MRLSTQHMYQQNIDAMSHRMNTNNDAYMRISAGKTLLSASDDPAGAASAVVYQDALAKIELYSAARNSARSSMEQTDNILSSVGNLLTKNLSQKLGAAMTDTMSADDRKVLGEEIKGIRDSLMDLANSRDGSDRYLFSGFKTSTAPFDADGNYQGGDTAIRQGVAQGTDMQVGFLGSDIFMSGTPDDLFKNLDNAVAELTADPIDQEKLKAALGAASKSVNAGIGSLGKVQAELGTNLQQIDALNMQGDVERNAMIEKLQAVLGADYGTQINLITEAKMAEFSLSASQMVFQSLQQMSLFAK